MNAKVILTDALDRIGGVLPREASRAVQEMSYLPGANFASTGVEIDGRHYVISVEDVSS